MNKKIQNEFNEDDLQELIPIETNRMNSENWNTEEISIKNMSIDNSFDSIRHKKYHEYLNTKRILHRTSHTAIKRFIISKHFIIFLNILAVLYATGHILYMVLVENWKPFSGNVFTPIAWLVTIVGLVFMLVLLLVSALDTSIYSLPLQNNAENRELIRAFFDPYKDIHIENFDFIQKHKMKLYHIGEFQLAHDLRKKSILSSSYSIDGKVGSCNFSMTSLQIKKTLDSTPYGIVKFKFSHKESWFEEVVISTKSFDYRDDEFTSKWPYLDRAYRMYGSKEQFDTLASTTDILRILELLKDDRDLDITISGRGIEINVYQNINEKPLQFIGRDFTTREAEIKSFLKYFSLHYIFNLDESDEKSLLEIPRLEVFEKKPVEPNHAPLVITNRSNKRKEARVVDWPSRFVEKGFDLLSTIPDDDVIPTDKTQALRFFKLRPSDIKVVILGLGPLQFKGVSNGLAYGVNKNVKKIPKILRNILIELEQVQGFIRTDQTLETWEEQGVLLLNKYLTGTSNKPSAHKDTWSEYTNNIIKFIDKYIDGVVWVFWGLKTIEFKSLLKNEHNIIVEDYSPSNLSSYKRNRESFVKLMECTDIEW